MNSKPVLTMREAVARHIPDGQEVMIGGFAFSDPTAVAHELIRQGRKGLYVMKTSGGVLVDMLIGAGCVDRLLFCHVWNSVGPVPAHCFRRALEKGTPQPVEVEELSYGAFTMALLAGACDLPFMPTTPVQGAGHFIERTFLPEEICCCRRPFRRRPRLCRSSHQAGLGRLPRSSRGQLGQRTIVRPGRRDALFDRCLQESDRHC